MRFESKRLKCPPEQELRSLYVDQRLTTRAIGQQFGVAHKTVLGWLARYGIPTRDANNGLRNRGVEPPAPELLYQLVHLQHYSYAQIARLYGADASVVKFWLKKHGIPRPTVWETRYCGNPPHLPDRDVLYELYVTESMSIRAISRLFGVDSGQITKRCREYGIPLRHDDGWDGGNRRVCQDGHRVRSSYEQRVDDWLAIRRIEHIYEPRLPFNLRFRADFLAAGWYIEVWGVKSVATYDARAKRKKALYATHQAPLIELPAYTFAPSRGGLWERKLAAKLMTSQRTSSSQPSLFSQSE